MTLFPEPLFLQMPTVTTATVDADRVRRHLAMLSRHGIGYRRAAEIAGLTPAVTRRIVYGRDGVLPTRVSRVKAEQLLAVHPDTATPILVDATGTRRRVQALVLAGWSRAKIADRLGFSKRTFGHVLYKDRVRASTAAAVTDLFDQIWNVAPPMITSGDKLAVTRSRAAGLAAGWVPALAWDDIDRDPAPAACPRDPDTIDVVAIELAMQGRDVDLTIIEREIAVARLHRLFLSDSTIAALLHVEPRTILRIRKRLHLGPVMNAAHELVLT